MLIREETTNDATAINHVTVAAFTDHPHSDGSEPRIASRLRETGALFLSLVAEIDGEIVGHAAFSRVTISNGTIGWFGLGPVSVLPMRQGKGIGGALITEGLARLAADNAGGCVVLGDPDYYQRFGFVHDSALAYPGPPPEYFQRIVFTGVAPTGTVEYAPAFAG